jgi:hypothetical protein
LTDLSTDESVDLSLNPSESDAVPVDKTINTQVSAAPDGGVILFEGRDAVPTINMSGTTLTEEQYTTLKTWASKKSLVTLQDHLGRILTIYITSFKPKMGKTSVQYPWRHSYQLSAIVLDESEA